MESSDLLGNLFPFPAEVFSDSLRQEMREGLRQLGSGAASHPATRELVEQLHLFVKMGLVGRVGWCRLGDRNADVTLSKGAGRQLYTAIDDPVRPL